MGPNVKRVACHRHRDGESHVYAPHGCAPVVTEKAAVPAALRLPYQWALCGHGFENVGRAEGAIGQSKDK
jgi:hypothetical protein